MFSGVLSPNILRFCGDIAEILSDKYVEEQGKMQLINHSPVV